MKLHPPKSIGIHQRFSALVFALACLLPYFQVQAQETIPRADQGWYINPYGRIHILVVFAEMDFDSSWANLDPEKNPSGSDGWKKGRLPFWREKLISPSADGDGFMTKYFRQASFGRFQVTGDFLDTIVSIPISKVRDLRGNVVPQEPFGNHHYRRTMVERLNALPQPRFHWGSTLRDFDNWGFKGQGMPNDNHPNGRTDIVMVVWRNIHVAYLADASGFVSPGSYGMLWGAETDMHSIFHAQSQMPKVIMRHEFSHMLYGGNNFHTAGGGVGTRTFMGTIGGWSNMSAADACSPVWNAWDRERLGWKNPQNNFVVSARCATSGAEINGVLAYGEPLCGDGLVVIRDFASTGDAIKIPLPHLPPKTMRQYLWLENHQAKPGYIDHERAMVPGLYAYIQAGKDAVEGNAAFGGENNYLWPIVAAGQHDFEIDPEGPTLLQTDGSENPFTGYHYLMRHTTDKNGDGKISITPDNQVKSEYYMPEYLRINGKSPVDSMFTFKNYPLFGMRTVAFLPGYNDKIGIGTNPAATPIYTHSGAQAQPDDNRRIFLNGISITLLRIDADGDAYLRIRWDDFVVEKAQRWCGDIVLTEKLEMKKTGDLALSQGWSPQLPVLVQKIDGKAAFAEPTILELKPGSVLDMAAGATLTVESGSTLLVRKGARLTLAKGAAIVVAPGGYLYVEEGAITGNLTRNKNLEMSMGALKGIHPLLEAKFKPLLPQGN